MCQYKHVNAKVILMSIWTIGWCWCNKDRLGGKTRWVVMETFVHRWSNRRELWDRSWTQAKLHGNVFRAQHRSGLLMTLQTGVRYHWSFGGGGNPSQEGYYNRINPLAEGVPPHIHRPPSLGHHIFTGLEYSWALIWILSIKNPAYGRQSISRPMRIVAPIPQ